MSAPALATPKTATGPKTTEGKARSSQNARKHGLTTGYLTLTDAERDAFETLTLELYECLQPEGPLEFFAVDQIADAAFRLDKIQRLIADLEAQHGGVDPLIVPEAQAMLKQLARYRAKEEMRLFRGHQQIEEYQTRRAARVLHVFTEEEHFLPALIEPRFFAKTDCTAEDRIRLLHESPIAPGKPYKAVFDENNYTQWIEKPKEELDAEIRQNELDAQFENAILSKEDIDSYLREVQQFLGICQNELAKTALE